MVIDPEEISRRFWSLPSKPDEEVVREQHFLDDRIHFAHLRREIDSHLSGVRTVLDVGAGTGRFSIPLAARGLEVTHLDISAPMIERARSIAEQEGVAGKMEFRLGRIADLVDLPARSFDLVLCFDAPISFAYPKHEEALAAVTRVAAKAVVVSVGSRLGYLPLCMNPFQKDPYIIDPESDDPIVRFYGRDRDRRLSGWTPDIAPYRSVLETGLCSPPEETIRAFEAGKSPWPLNYLFLPDELAHILEAQGLADIRLAGPGALARGLPKEILRRLLLENPRCDEFLELCYRHDSHPSVSGAGKGGLVASGSVRLR